MDFEDHVLHALDELTKVSAATQQSVVDLREGLHVALPAIKADVADLSEKVGNVEKRQSWIVGIGTAAAFFITTGLTWVGLHHRG